MIRRADIAVYDPNEKLQLVAEVKRKVGASQEWVTHMRRNLLVHALIPQSPFFLLALPDFFYLWKNGTPLTLEAPPDYQIPAAEALASYLNQLPQPLSKVSEDSLELLVTSWLQDLVHSNVEEDRNNPALRWLFDSGLYEAIKHGSVATEAAV